MYINKFKMDWANNIWVEGKRCRRGINEELRFPLEIDNISNRIY